MTVFVDDIFNDANKKIGQFVFVLQKYLLSQKRKFCLWRNENE